VPSSGFQGASAIYSKCLKKTQQYFSLKTTGWMS
jgi:hypothetical protein